MTHLLNLGLVVVLAGQASSSTELSPEAAQLYQQGAAKYRLGQFKQAVTKFRAALAVANRPSLLFNIAQCYRQLGRRDEAIFNYKLYLSESERLAPDKPVPFGAEVRARLQQLEAAAAASRVVTKPAVSPSSSPVRATAKPPKPCKQCQTSCPPFYKRWWFWTLVGVAVAGATTTTVLALQPDTTVAPVGSIPPGQVELR